MSKLHAMLIFGTRPEAVKMAPLLRECLCRSDQLRPTVCLTGQHREMLVRAVEYFGIRADVQFDLMRPNQTLAGLTARCIEHVDEVLLSFRPDCVVVQGDTTTALAASTAAFYRRIPLVHVEAGLRTGSLLAPWPEEFNRRVADMVAAVNCAPTRRAADVLAAEGVPSAKIHVTGNTVVDALLQTIDREKANAGKWQEKYVALADRRMILITGHRRESFGRPFEQICRAIATLAMRFDDCEFVYPVHLNENVRQPAYEVLGNVRNIRLIDPVAYPEFVWLMDRSALILTDSGGVQEEAPSLGKPVLVLRDVTERPEAVEAGAARLVGTSTDAIVAAVATLLTNPEKYAACQIDRNPYGDGRAAERIVDLMLRQGFVGHATDSEFVA